MEVTAVTKQSPVPLRGTDEILVTGDEDADEEVVPEYAVTNDVEEEADTSTAQNAHHRSGISREKWIILALF